MRVVALVVATVVTGSLTESALATTRKVPQQFATIQEAINASAAGDTVLVSAGVYEENLEVVNAQHGLTLRGLGKVVLDARPNGAAGTGPGMNVGVDDVHIENFTVRHGLGDMYGGGVAVFGANARLKNLVVLSCERAGIRVEGPFARIENCRVFGCRDMGIEVVGDDALITKCQVRQCDNTGIDVTGNRATISKTVVKNIEDDSGIVVTGAQAKIISNTVLDPDGDAIDVVGTEFEIRSNTVRSGQDTSGIRVGSTSMGLISNNTCIDCHESGIEILPGSGFVLITKNKVLRCGSEGDPGILVSGGFCTLDGNVITESVAAGISFTGNFNRAWNNKISNTFGDGIHITGTGSELDANVVKGCAAEGLENNGLDTEATDNVFKGNRIDVTSTTAFNTFTGNTFTTGGTSTTPEISN
jgi:hypothetical protein